MNKQYLLIGASAAGIGCALRLRMLDADAEITVLTAERDLPYNKCHLADVLLGEKPLDGLTLCSAELLAQKRITLVRDAQVMDIDHVQKIVHCKGNNESFSYDSLCLATGKSPRMLPLFEGLNFTNLFTFYYKSDLEAVITYVNRCQPRTAMVIGGGLTGLEAADGLRARGLAVTIVEAAPQVLPSLWLLVKWCMVMKQKRIKLPTYICRMAGPLLLILWFVPLVQRQIPVFYQKHCNDHRVIASWMNLCRLLCKISMQQVIVA
jgi:NAD(P)H-nitrite reductase large subunit